MTKEELQVVICGLLHDIGKIIYSEKEITHSENGYEYLKEIFDSYESEYNNNILEAVKYHHNIDKLIDNINSLAYVTCIADEILMRNSDKNSTNDSIVEVSHGLESVFDKLGASEKTYYKPEILKSLSGINKCEELNYPSSQKIQFDKKFYEEFEEDIKFVLEKKEIKNLLKMGDEEKEVDTRVTNLLLTKLEKWLSYVPTDKEDNADISLYEHSKLVAGVSSCVYKYLKEKNISNLKEYLCVNKEEFFNEKAYILFSMDVTGIQSFIYTIHSSGALKTLRAKSGYLEIMMEHMNDMLLDKAGLTRANLIYVGGGHSYILLPNTCSMKEIIVDFTEEINEWFLDKFEIDLYIATAYIELTSNDLKNKEYGKVLENLSPKIEEKKANKYSAEVIINKLNKAVMNYSEDIIDDRIDNTGECKVCKKIAKLNKNDECSFCSVLKKFSDGILKAKYFVIYKTFNENNNELPLPGGYYLSACNNKENIPPLIIEDKCAHIYAINRVDENEWTNIYLGNYYAECVSLEDGLKKMACFKDLATSSIGIERIGVLRADVDNLGWTFSRGLRGCNTISRSAMLSKHMSMFFKYYINVLLNDGKRANVTIVYSGGDDLFIVGAWNEIIDIGIKINEEFSKYTQGKLSISGGIGIYSANYPISQIAKEVGKLEDMSKEFPGKAAVTLIPEIDIDSEGKIYHEYGTYKWSVLKEDVIGGKYDLINTFLNNDDKIEENERGMSFMYHLLELIRNRQDRVNIARYIYLLARMEPNGDDEDKKEHYRKFKEEMLKWLQNENDCKQLKTAINYYAYMNRGRSEKGEK